MRANKVYRKFFLSCIGLLFSVFAAIATFNGYFDPLMIFSSVHPGNRYVPVIDTRVQKTNRLYHGNEKYDALLLGSSRAEQFRQQDFLPYRLFNYALPSLYPDEAGEYLDFFLKKNGNGRVVVFLGLDFYGSNAITHEHAKPPGYYHASVVDPFQTVSPYIGRNALKYSFKMLRGKKEVFKYDRVTIDKVTQFMGQEESDRQLNKQLDLYAKTIYGDYRYNRDYYTILRQLKEGHPNVEFVVFTTPVTSELFALLVKSGRLPDYDRWLRDIVRAFGRAYNFMYVNRFTMDRRNFMDAHHLYPERATPLMRIMTGRQTPEDEGIGVLLTAGNLDAQIDATIKQSLHIQETMP